MRVRMIVSAFVVLFLLPGTANARHESSSHSDQLRTTVIKERTWTWQWQDQAGERRWPTKYRERVAHPPALQRLAKLWRHRHRAVQQRYRRMLLRRQQQESAAIAAWMPTYNCEHGAGGWASNTGNGYYGGLQFDHGTWVAHGGLAYGYNANEATPAQQVHVASKLTYDGWPNCPNP